MIGILNRWRQFGRRYFWPHLLLGMVAASLGLPQASAHNHATLAETPSRSLDIRNTVRFNRLALLQENIRRPAVTVDYWHQHAIRTVIRHLSFSLTPSVLPAADEAQPLQEQKLALLDSLNALLTHEIRQPTIIQYPVHHHGMALPVYQTGLWLSQIQGIRAGPLQIFSAKKKHLNYQIS